MTHPTSSNLYPVAGATSSSKTFVDVFLPRDPTQYDVQYQTQQKWLNTASGSFWILQGFSSNSATLLANWEKIGSISMVETLTGNTGGAVAPDAHSNINVVGDGVTVTVSGDPATNTLTISAAGEEATLYVENSGTATPSGGMLNVLGGTGITTVGSGNTITVDLVIPVTVPDGGTGDVNFTAYAPVCGGTTAVNPLQSAATGIENVGFVLTSTGSSSLPTWQIGSGGAFTAINIQVFTADGLYTPTVGMKYCIVECVGGGGGGGGGSAVGGTGSAICSSGGGGAGSYSRSAIDAATIGFVQAVTVGPGGLGGIGNAGGADGGDSSLGVLVTANGGSGGLGVAATYGGVNYNASEGGDGGLTGIGQFTFQGAGGGCGGTVGSGGSGSGAYVASGVGGGSYFGGGGRSRLAISQGSVSVSGQPYGSGGSGCAVIANPSNTINGNGGTGANGVVIVTEFVAPL